MPGLGCQLGKSSTPNVHSSFPAPLNTRARGHTWTRTRKHTQDISTKPPVTLALAGQEDVSLGNHPHTGDAVCLHSNILDSSVLPHTWSNVVISRQWPRDKSHRRAECVSAHEKDVSLPPTGEEQKEGLRGRARNQGSDCPLTKLLTRTLVVRGSEAQRVSRAGVGQTSTGPLPTPRDTSQRGPENRGLGWRPGARNREAGDKPCTLNRAAAEPSSSSPGRAAGGPLPRPSHP